MIEKVKRALDQGHEYPELFADMSKTTDSLPHNLIIANLHV